MLRKQTFQVIRNRMQFKCPICGAKRIIHIPPRSSIQRKKIRCHKCDEMISCALNRRETPRDRLTGKMTMQTKRGDEIEVSLRDKSAGGAAFDVTITDLKRHRISTGQKVRFSCSWNRNLLGNSRFEIVNIHGQRIGVKKIS